jgi:hypothetical protein
VKRVGPGWLNFSDTQLTLGTIFIYSIPPFLLPSIKTSYFPLLHTRLRSQSTVRKYRGGSTHSQHRGLRHVGYPSDRRRSRRCNGNASIFPDNQCSIRLTRTSSSCTAPTTLSIRAIPTLRAHHIANTRQARGNFSRNSSLDHRLGVTIAAPPCVLS